MARKYDGTEHKSWPARIVINQEPLLVLDARFDQDIEHDLMGTISRGTISTEYYWFDRWYNVFRFSDETGKLGRFYCNINIPPVFDGRTLTYVDLDIDVLVEPNFSHQILDLDEFEKNAEKYFYPLGIRDSASRALGELIKLIETRSFPFSR